MTQDQTVRDSVATSTAASAEMPAARGGVRALVGVGVAIVGALAAMNPDNAWLRAINHVMPELADALPTLITACGAVLAAFSQPPKLARRRP